MRHLGGMNTMFVRAETRSTLMHVTGVLILASSLRSELSDDGGSGGSLIAAVPVALGGHCDHPKGQFGNHTSAMMVPLPVDVDDPLERLQDLHRLTDQAKARHRAMGPELIERWATLVPPWVISSGARLAGRYDLAAHLPPVFNLIVSNVARPPVPVYRAGSEVTGTYPLGPLIGGAGLNITVISHRDRVHIGVIADPSLVGAPSRLAEGVADGVAELSGMASSPAGLQAAGR